VVDWAMIPMRFLLNICFAMSVAVIGPAIAQDATEGDASLSGIEATAPLPLMEAPPERIGRLSLRSGKASLRASIDTGWTEAELNQPIFNRVALRTDPQARVEVRIGANSVELSNSTEIEFISLRYRFTQIAASWGRINFDLPQLGEGESVEIDTPWGAVWLLAPGSYDIEMGSGDQPARVAVFAGAARLVSSGNDTRIEAGQVAALTGPGPVAATIEPAVPDAFVDWCRERERNYDQTRLVAPYYISPYMTGFAELDSAGSWKTTAQYGAVWVPDAIPEDWVPYRYGHWSWIAPWGWTWIDDASWGFAPFHYGRWALIEERWAWVPGSFVDRPIYAPAVVAFLGTPGIGLSSAEGAAVGWFPLAPGEAYWPSYTRDLNYVRALNLGNVQDVGTIRMRADGEPPLEVFNGVFAHRQFASVVPRPIFSNGRPVATALVTVPEQRLQNAPVLMGSPQILPASPQRIARAAAAVQTDRKNVPTDRVVIGISRKANAKLVRSAALQPRGRGQPVVIRGAHMHAPSYAGLAHGRQLLVLHLARNSSSGAGKGARR
jgi:hypothetical protein